jgi:hypothetical protein
VRLISTLIAARSSASGNQQYFAAKLTPDSCAKRTHKRRSLFATTVPAIEDSCAMNGMNHHPSENWLAAASASQITHRALREVIALLSGCGSPSFETP